jgi:O-acetylhomoserine/O-acetylserine sulfhydrylase-like pyridoxal-dependent enzyme
VYSATHAFVHRDLKELGISATLVDIDTHPDTWTPLLQPTTKVGMR